MTITCSRCTLQVDAMTQPPLPTPLGHEVQRQVCAACWREWLRTQVILINEYRLNLIDPQARQTLEGQMRAFLNLATAARE